MEAEEEVCMWVPFRREDVVVGVVVNDEDDAVVGIIILGVIVLI